MKTLTVATLLALSATAVSAEPQIPTWANPDPAQPVATDGSPLPRLGARSGSFEALVSGRSVVVGQHRH